MQMLWHLLVLLASVVEAAAVARIRGSVALFSTHVAQEQAKSITVSKSISQQSASPASNASVNVHMKNMITAGNSSSQQPASPASNANMDVQMKNMITAWKKNMVTAGNSSSQQSGNVTAGNISSLHSADANASLFMKEFVYPCSFMNEHNVSARCDIERNSGTMVLKWIQPTSVVLEVGARYGTVSCAISERQLQSGKLVSVEPDATVWNALEQNRVSHNCNFKVLQGVVGTTSVQIIRVHAGNQGYGTMVIPVGQPVPPPAPGQGHTVGNVAQAYSLAQVQQTYGMHFDTLVADCEGCLPTLFAENPGLGPQLKLILTEVHNPAEEHIVAQLQAYGFQLIDQLSRQRVLYRAAR